MRCSIWSVAWVSRSMPDMSWLTSITAVTALRASSTACLTSTAISCELSALFRANLPTSSATTAKPLPCSPARAASMAAFRDSKLVLLAIFSITSVILLIFSELVAMLLTTLTISSILTMLPRTSVNDWRDF